MKLILICSLMLSCFAICSATCGDAREMLRDRLILCSQFIIEHPYPAMLVEFTAFVDSTDYRCRAGNRIHDCHIHRRQNDYR